jgi:hypothetical protein
LDIIRTNSPNYLIADVAIVLRDPLYESKNINLEHYQKFGKYIILLYKTKSFSINQEFLKKLCDYFFPKKTFYPFYIEPSDNNIENIKETSFKKLCKLKEEEILFIQNKKNNIIDVKFNVTNINSNAEFNIDFQRIIDKNIKCIIDSIFPKKKTKSKTNIKIKILIQEPYNILFKYLNNIFKKAEFVLLNNSIDEKITDLKKCISTYETNEIANTSLFSYITENDDKKFDLIILDDTFNSNNLFNDKEILKSIKSHMDETGQFIIHLIVDNIYLKQNIYQNLASIFKNVEIKNKNIHYELNTVLACSDIDID